MRAAIAIGWWGEVGWRAAGGGAGWRRADPAGGAAPGGARMTILNIVVLPFDPADE
jgi:hypothetical protein